MERTPHSELQSFDASSLVDNKDDFEERHELLESIGRLCQLAKQKEGTRFDKEAQTGNRINAMLLENDQLTWLMRKATLTVLS